MLLHVCVGGTMGRKWKAIEDAIVKKDKFVNAHVCDDAKRDLNRAKF